MKRVMIVTLALLLLAALYPTATVHAEEALTSGDYEYRVLEDGTVKIIGYKGTAEFLEIPGSLNGLAVTGIGDLAFTSSNNLKEIIIPDSVISIGDYAFFICQNLSSIIIPDSVISIGEYAFSWCGKLSSITLPDSIISIGTEAFSRCGKLNSINIPNSVTNIGDNPFEYCNYLKQVVVSPDHPVFATIDGVLFSKEDKRLIWYPLTKKDTAYEIPQGILSIGAGAFYECTSLSSITIPDSVISIGNEAFSGCGNLSSITLPNSVMNIGCYAFSWCGKLSSVTIPDSVTSIGAEAFEGCSSLQKVIVAPDSYTQQYCEDNSLPFVYQENTD